MTRRILAVLVVVMMMLTALPAMAEGKTSDWREPYAETVEIHIAAQEITNAIFAEGEDMFNNLWTKRWKELYNVNVVVDWVSIDYETKLNLAIASNTLPDAFRCNAVQFNQLKTAGYLADLTDVYETYGGNTLKSVMEENWDIVETAMDGDEILAIPQLHYGYECETSQMWARSDWMEEAGLTGFESIEDIENAMQIFKDNYNAKYLALRITTLQKAWNVYSICSLYSSVQVIEMPPFLKSLCKVDGLQFIINRGGSTLGCRSLSTHQQRRTGLSTTARSGVHLVVDWLG